MPPLVVTDTSVVVVATLRPSQDCRHDPGVDLLDVWQLRLGWMCHHIGNELCQIGVGYKRAIRVENHDDSMLSRALRLDKIAEGVELEISSNDAGHLAAQGCADRDYRCADAKREIRR